ncbi:MAG: permease prefix domain 1-containing protein [Pseudolysinimonas sp.]
MTTTLTDRYVWAVQRSLPEKQRADIDQELRGAIADTVDSKIDSGTDPVAAEREVIVELGDPYRLAAGYADRPLHLVGPKVFPDYIRLLKVLYAIVLPIVFVAILLGQLLGQPDSFWGAFGSTIGAIITVAVHLGFWTTLVFALIERSPEYKATAWNPDTLPQLPTRGAIKLSDAVASGVWFVSIVGGLIWAQYFSLFRDADGEVVPVFDPALGVWLAYFLVLAAFELGFRVLLYRERRWTFPLAAVNLVGHLAFAIPFLWLLLNSSLMNPEFLARADIAPLFERDGVVTIIVLIVALAGSAGSAIEGFVKAGRAAREPR